MLQQRPMSFIIKALNTLAGLAPVAPFIQKVHANKQLDRHIRGLMQPNVILRIS